MENAFKLIGIDVALGYAYSKIPLNIQTDLTGKEIYSVFVPSEQLIQRAIPSLTSRSMVNVTQLRSIRITFVDLNNDVLYSRIPLKTITTGASGLTQNTGDIPWLRFVLPPITGKIDFSKSFIESQDQPKLPPVFIPLIVCYWQ
jgi:hypothetical protein